jgi:hypothetical protein
MGNEFAPLMSLIARLGGLSVFAQACQELYKFLSNSKAQTYTRVFGDLLGPAARSAIGADSSATLGVSGPFQRAPVAPGQAVLPVADPQVSSTIKQGLPHWDRRTLEALQVEASLAQEGNSVRSPGWKAFRKELHAARKVSYRAHSIDRFLSQSESSDLNLTPPQTLTSFRQAFAPHLSESDRQAPQLRANFDYAYRRRNRRQSFTIGMLLALGLNQPLGRIYDRAYANPTSTASAIAGTTETGTAGNGAGTPSTQVIPPSQPQPTQCGTLLACVASGKWMEALGNLLGCLATAVLVSFGAPFWNDLIGLVGKRPDEVSASTPAQ